MRNRGRGEEEDEEGGVLGCKSLRDLSVSHPTAAETQTSTAEHLLCLAMTASSPLPSPSLLSSSANLSGEPFDSPPPKKSLIHLLHTALDL